MRPFRFLAEPSGIIDGKTLAELARHAEAIGIDTLVKSDHLLDLLAPIRAKPVRARHPAFLIGGGGRRTLTVAGREADIISLAPRILTGQRSDPRSVTWAATEEKIGWVREAAGDRFDGLEFNVYPSLWPIVVTDDLHGEARKVIDRLRTRTGVELTEDEVIAAPNIFIGSVDRFVEKFGELRERLGISSFMVGEIDELAPVVERLAGT